MGDCLKGVPGANRGPSCRRRVSSCGRPATLAVEPSLHLVARGYRPQRTLSHVHVKVHDVSALHCVPQDAGNIALCAGGNLRLVAALAEGVPIAYNSVVRRIAYSRAGVTVRTAEREFKGELQIECVTECHCAVACAAMGDFLLLHHCIMSR